MAYWLWSVPPEHYAAYLRTGTFAVRRQGRAAMQGIRPGDRIVAYLPGRRVVAGLFEATSAAFEDATALVPGGSYPHRVRVRPLVALDEEVWLPYEAFAGKLAVLGEYGGLREPSLQFRAVAQRVVHPLPVIDGKVFEFLVRARAGSDFPALQAALEAVRAAQREGAPSRVRKAAVAEAPAAYAPEAWERAEAMERLLAHIEASGFVFEPWQVAAYVTALRTKPFVILAGVTGVGKSRLPVLVAEATGGAARLVPVRPDWTDSAEVLGYVDLQGVFRPGALLRAAREAAESPRLHHVCVLDEMNLARPEHYLAEVLSRIEARRPAEGGGFAGANPAGFESLPLLGLELALPDALWQSIGLPPNLGLVGTVNVDESAHGFSRKVLDRAFTLELSEVRLGRWAEAGEAPEVAPWPASAWFPRALTLGGLGGLGPEERATLEGAVAALVEANALLAPSGLGVGYRSRDEVALFALHAAEAPEAFRTREGEPVAPLDLALQMKLLPRIAGGSRSVAQALFGLLGWAREGEPLLSEDDAREAVEAFDAMGRPAALVGARFPRTAARLARMAARLLEDGYASFWD